MADLIARIRAARRSWVTAGGFEFLLQRPTQYQAARLVGSGGEVTDVFLRAGIVDWRKVRETDIVPGGTADPLPFDADVCIEWLQDRPELWQQLAEELFSMIRLHAEKADALGKN